MTKRDQIVSFIANYWREHGYAPSLREIAEATGFTQARGVSYHLALLRDEGRVTYRDGIARTVRVIG